MATVNTGNAGHDRTPAIGHQEAAPERTSIDISFAENAFHELARELSRHSQRSTTRASGSDTTVDLEKQAPDQDAPFDLRDYLSSSNDANTAAGIQHKHVGVTWENLQVDVFGGVDHKVRLCFPFLSSWTGPEHSILPI